MVRKSLSRKGAKPQRNPFGRAASLCAFAPLRDKYFLHRMRFVWVFALFFATAAVARGNVSLPDVISDGMVLQQKQKVPIWGKADPGESITVRFAGQSKKTIAAADGNWIVKLDPLMANATPASMVISGNNTIELKNVLVGEVWLVAGQSNMQRLLSETADGEAAIAAADHVWHWANAKIVGKDRVEVWSDAVPQPVAVRYAFNNNPKHANLTNDTGLPATPFRTDNWPGPTDGKR